MKKAIFIFVFVFIGVSLSAQQTPKDTTSKGVVKSKPNQNPLPKEPKPKQNKTDTTIAKSSLSSLDSLSSVINAKTKEIDSLNQALLKPIPTSPKESTIEESLWSELKIRDYALIAGLFLFLVVIIFQSRSAKKIKNELKIWKEKPTKQGPNIQSSTNRQKISELEEELSELKEENEKLQKQNEALGRKLQQGRNVQKNEKEQDVPLQDVPLINYIERYAEILPTPDKEYQNRNLLTSPTEDTLFLIKIEQNNSNNAIFMLRDDAAISKRILYSGNMDGFLKSCVYEEPPKQTSNRIITYQPGKMQRSGDVWYVTEKAKIRFE